MLPRDLLGVVSVVLIMWWWSRPVFTPAEVTLPVLPIAAAAQRRLLVRVPLLCGDPLLSETPITEPACYEATIHAGSAEGDRPIAPRQHFNPRHLYGPYTTRRMAGWAGRLDTSQMPTDEQLRANS